MHKMKRFSRLMIAFCCLTESGWGGQVPGTERYMEFPNALPGKILKVHKVFEQGSGRGGLQSNLPEVSTVADLLAVEKSEEAAMRKINGNLFQPLAEKIGAMDPSEKVRVAIRLKTAPHTFLDKTRYSVAEQIASSRLWTESRSVLQPSALLKRHGLGPILELRGNDIAIVEATKGQLQALKDDPDFASIWEDVLEEPLSVSLSSLAPSGFNPGPVPSGAGAGVKAATFEYGLTSSFLGCQGVTPSYYDAFSYAGLEIQKRHSQATFTVMTVAAPGAWYYHRNSRSFNGSGDVGFIVNNGIQTLSMSFTRGGTNPHRATYSEFLTMDEMAYTYPYPVFANPSGNSGYGYEVNWQSYNAISVGNVRHTNNSTYEMAECTQAKNPPPRYGYSCISGSGPDCAGDREMPHIVAPGFPYSGSAFDNGCTEGLGSLTCGTSLSAPLVNGIAASVIASDSRMVSWPEKVRAALILTAQNVESGDWTVSGDERDGTGVVSGSEAIAFAQGHTSVYPGNTAVENGMYASSMYASDFGSSKRFNFLVPNPKPSGRHLRVVLTWDSNPDVNAGANALSDLDLIVQHNGGSSYSSSWDSNVEVVDIPADNLTAGGSYYIDISPYMSRIPSSGPNYFYCALAWTWVKDHAP